MIYNFKEHEKGDTLNQVEFQLIINTVPVNLTGTAVKAVFMLGSQTNIMSLASGLTLTDSSIGKFKINSQIINWDAGLWKMEIRFTFPDGRVKTYLKGQLNVIN